MESAKLMLVDESENGPRLARMLEAHGFDVVIAVDGEEVLGTVAGNAPDLIIMNVQLSGRNGYEITRELSDGGLADGVPIILLTSAQTEGALDAQREWGVNAGASEVLAKPIAEDVLLAEIRAHLAGESAAALRSTGHASRDSAIAGAGLGERALDELERRLAEYIGPIARMLVRKAEREASTTTELYRRLAEHISDKAERERFISWTVSQE